MSSESRAARTPEEVDIDIESSDRGDIEQLVCAGVHSREARVDELLGGLRPAQRIEIAQSTPVPFIVHAHTSFEIKAISNDETEHVRIAPRGFEEGLRDSESDVVEWNSRRLAQRHHWLQFQPLDDSTQVEWLQVENVDALRKRKSRQHFVFGDYDLVGRQKVG